MKNNFEHKGLTAQIEYSNEDNCFVGRVQNIEGLVMFFGNSVDELRSEFIAAVDEYIAARKAAGLPAEKSYSGTFNVRVGSDLHRKAQNAAARRKMSLNEYVRQAIQTLAETDDAHESSAHCSGVVRLAFGRHIPGDVHVHTIAAGGVSVPSEQSWDVLGASTREHRNPFRKREWIQ